VGDRLLVGVNLIFYGMTVLFTWFSLRRAEKGGGAATAAA
jgi:hypothetical protein